jgi:hypothetical protein
MAAREAGNLMNRRTAALALVLGRFALCAIPLVAKAQQAGRVYRIDYLSDRRASR